MVVHGSCGCGRVLHQLLDVVVVVAIGSGSSGWYSK